MELRELGSRYYLAEAIGHGGMAVVHRAWDDKLKRWVALKELRLPISPDPTLALRFMREARTAAALNDPHIVHVYDHLVIDDTPFISMEFMRRGSLQAYVNRTSLAHFMGVMRGVLRGLANAASEGVVHRDLKPANLLVADDGSVKIADFGIAKARTATADVFATVTGTTSGTPQYMAPEQALARDIGPHTDLYSLGIIAYEMLVGRTPFYETREPIAIAHHHLETAIPAAASVRAEIDPELSDWIARLLTKDWRERPADAEAVWLELEEIALRELGPTWHREAPLPLLAPLPKFEPPTLGGVVGGERSGGESVIEAKAPAAAPAVAKPAARKPAPSKPAAPPVEPPAVPREEARVDDSMIAGYATFGAAARPEPEPAAEGEEPVAEEPMLEEPVVEDAPVSEAELPVVVDERPDPEPPAARAEPDQPEVHESPLRPAFQEPEPELDEVEPDGPAPLTEESLGWRTAIGSTLRGRQGAPVDDEPVDEAAGPHEPADAEEEDATAAPLRVIPAPERSGPAPRPTSRPEPAPRPQPAKASTSPEVRRRRLVAAAALAGVVIAAGGGYAVGHGSPAPDPAAAQLPTTAVTADGIALKVPGGWKPVAVSSGTKAGAATVAQAVGAGPSGGGDDGVVAATLTGKFGDDLLPAGTKAGAAEATVLGDGVEALRHTGADLGALGKGTAFTVAAGDGVAVLLCRAGVPDATCDAIATTFRLPGAALHPLGPDAPTASAVGTALDRLAKEAATPRAQLTDANSRAGQARSARRAATPYAEAAGRLRGVPTNARSAAAVRALADATAQVGSGLRDLAGAADAGSTTRFDAARKALATRQQAMGKAAERLRALGYGVRSAR
ncbi:MAG: protein kinase [Solirubrobacteraceae bacterium]|nr:protein kinase [Solirubrobacteraceae bacterium]